MGSLRTLTLTILAIVAAIFFFHAYTPYHIASDTFVQEGKTCTTIDANCWCLGLFTVAESFPPNTSVKATNTAQH